MRQLNDDTFNILTSFNCQTHESYGAITGQYLVFWDNEYKKYSSYEIFYK
ncbi:unnamed protein product [Paramecium pentaurelia]|uniref:Uncharacterized protein n=1 Tax=Paramecium pentaurelia TaxID=43138 RepID=A0A8S1U0Y1_9CILI|nr:unnamed protein product [Paramecium pentaurelia]